MLTCASAVCLSVCLLGINRKKGMMAVSQGHSFFFPLTACKMDMVVVGIGGICSKGLRSRSGGGVAKRKADSRSSIDHCYGNSWMWDHFEILTHLPFGDIKMTNTFADLNDSAVFFLIFLLLFFFKLYLI